MMRFLVFIGTFFSLATSLHAKTIVTNDGDIQVTVNRDAYNMLVGDTINITIEVLAPPDTTITPEPNHDFEPFQVTNLQTFLDVPDGDNRVWQWLYALDSFDASVNQITLPTIEWVRSSGESGAIMLDPIELKMKSAVDGNIQEATLEDIKGYRNLSKTQHWTTTIVVIGIALLIASLYLVFKRRKTFTTLPPYEEAIIAIESLKAEQLDFHPFYTELSGIVRRYIERRFHIYAQRQTTREFLNKVKQHPLFEQVDRRSLASFLTAADLVKFAKHIPSEEAKVDALKQAIAFVEHTREVESMEHAA